MPDQTAAGLTNANCQSIVFGGIGEAPPVAGVENPASIFRPKLEV
jgi:hypothetical protein